LPLTVMVKMFAGGSGRNSALLVVACFSRFGEYFQSISRILSSPVLSSAPQPLFLGFADLVEGLEKGCNVLGLGGDRVPHMTEAEVFARALRM